MSRISRSHVCAPLYFTDKWTLKWFDICENALWSLWHKVQRKYSQSRRHLNLTSAVYLWCLRIKFTFCNGFDWWWPSRNDVYLTHEQITDVNALQAVSLRPPLAGTSFVHRKCRLFFKGQTWNKHIWTETNEIKLRSNSSQDFSFLPSPQHHDMFLPINECYHGVTTSIVL